MWQMLSGQEEAVALEHLKSEVYRKDVLHRESTAADSTPPTSASAGPCTSASGGKSVTAAGEATGQQEDGSAPLPKRLCLFKFVKMPEKDQAAEEQVSFDERFRSDIEKIRKLYQPLR